MSNITDLKILLEMPIINHINGLSHQKMLPLLTIRGLTIYYGNNSAVQDIHADIHRNKITALIGPSGCGKSSLLRSLNRMNDLIPTARMEGSIIFDGETDIGHSSVNPAAVRRQIGMVFQKPNPFPKSIYENVAWGLRINGYRDNLNQLVESALRQAALWDEVKDKLKENALNLSGGQQQRLCISRALAINPKIILLDEPCSALDPLATAKIEALLKNLKLTTTIVIVTHNMQQARRISDYTLYLLDGQLVEQGETQQVFNNPQHISTRKYLNGEFG